MREGDSGHPSRSKPARGEVARPRRGGGETGPEREASGLITLLRYELLQIARDRRTLLIAVVAPLVVFPLLILLMRWTEERRVQGLEEALYEYAVTGPEAGWGREQVRAALDEEVSGEEPGLRFAERPSGDPDSLLREGEIEVLVRAFPPEGYRTWRDSVRERTGEGGPVEAEGEGRGRGQEEGGEGERSDPGERAAFGTPDAPGDPGDPVASGVPGSNVGVPAVPALVLAFRGSSDLSREAADRLSERLRALRERQREAHFRTRGLAVSLDELGAVESVPISTPSQEGGRTLALFLTPLIVMLLVGGGTVAAADAISGEKERGTLETLLTTAVGRGEIVGAKLLAIVALGLVVTLVNLGNLFLYLFVGIFELPEGLAVGVAPEVLLLLLLLYLPVVLLVAAVLLLISGLAGSYKEYQLYALPTSFLFLVPAAAAVLPGIDLRSAVAAVPLAGVSVAVKEILTGEYDWAFLALAFASTSAAAGACARLTHGFLSTERLITSQDTDEAELRGGPSLFPRRVLAWFGVFWALLLVVSLWWGEVLGIRGQVAVNVVGIFLGGSLFLVRRYRLPWREALALRAPRPAVWLAVVVGAPSAFLTGAAVFQAARLVFPVPDQVLESFGQYLLPEGLPFYQVLLFLCVLPGICEEVAFRGVLLHGLRRRMGYVGLALAVGGIFGLFHVDLFRLVPTAYLGAILTAVVLLSGSIYPAMLWHALNNAAALVPAYWGIEATELPGEVAALGFAGLGVAFWILWRERTPYPGVGRR